MSWVIAILAAAGLMLFLVGVTAPRRVSLLHRIDPYLSGLRGGPSDLLGHRRPVQGARLQSAATAIFGNGDADLEDRLSAAGSDLDVPAFRLEQVMWGTAGLLLVAVVGSLTWLAGVLDLRALPVLAGIAVAIGFLGRDWALTRSIEARRRHLAEELPVAIDLLTLSIMSGESVPAAFARVAETLGEGIGREFRSVVADMSIWSSDRRGARGTCSTRSGCVRREVGGCAVHRARIVARRWPMSSAPKRRTPRDPTAIPVGDGWPTGGPDARTGRIPHPSHRRRVRTLPRLGVTGAIGALKGGSDA